MLKRLVFVLVVLLVAAGAAAIYFLFAPPPAPPTGTAAASTITVDGRERRYVVVAPAEMPTAGAPVLIALHGSEGSGDQLRSLIGRTLERLTAADHAYLVFPDGYEGHFNDCRRAANYSARTLGIDDVAFLRAIVARLVSEERVNPRRVFALGFSNGGQMALRLALEAPDLVSGAIVIAASVPSVENFDCPLADLPARVAVFIAGTRDPINPFNGGEVAMFGVESRGNVRPARASAEWYAQTLGLTASPPQSLGNASGLAAYREDWSGAEGRVRLVTIESGGHTIPQAAYRFPRILGRTFGSDAVLESSWRFVAGEPGQGAAERR
jgi:polyhydroxybutyrate depolymerase